MSTFPLQEQNKTQNFECSISKIGGEWCFIPPNTIIEEIQKEVSRYSNPKQSQIKSIFNSFYPKHIQPLTLNIQLHIAYEILRRHLSFKMIGIMIILKNGNKIDERHIEDIGLILDNHLHDHTSIECISTKLLYELIVARPNIFLSKLESWKNKSNCPCRMRACCSTFTKYCKEKQGDQIWEVCSSCIKVNERFVQLGVGCSLKELCNVDENKVIEFIKKYVQFFSRDGLKYAVEKIKDLSIKRDLLNLSRSKQNGIGEYVNGSNKVSEDIVSN
ncbi:hypothetical protein, conserved [Entamoeba dispar SAW760]|uniref:Uncharacterized protein n=1 Tax=Entamoeba dispar (strain ATCC PRA-260 / SAW760) TaxID=370354 RepID=B0EQE0_ENTDS|nr:uncharacterized protein EDI_122020 [Entamoeba dispar SAW760]EDR23265.1 hypothetical protein, conserved [Entamoeba dispar SAW760]|eukprot:EDR23265.1 hypothetical protein, conserved [Entamoeba dispar SAW760]